MIALRIFAMAAVLSVALAPTALAKPKSKSKSDPAQALTERINDVRADHGLPALRPAPKLMRSAGAYARRLMRADGFSHGSSYRGTGFRTVGEMLSYNRGWRVNPGPPVRMWLRSSGHRGLMLSRSFRYIGASPARGRYNGALTTIWVVQLGAH